MYFDQLLQAARKLHVVYSDQLLDPAPWYTLYLIMIPSLCRTVTYVLSFQSLNFSNHDREVYVAQF